MSKKRFVGLVAGLFAAITATGAGAVNNIAVCGASDGYGYYAETGLLSGRAEAGVWIEDAIDTGRMTLTLDDSGAFDLLITDASGSIFSAKGDGATIVPVAATTTVLSIVVAYPLVVETYTFLLSDSGPEVIWTSNKHSAPIIKVSAMRAPCSLVNLF
jgi:hypothetical protein